MAGKKEFENHCYQHIDIPTHDHIQKRDWMESQHVAYSRIVASFMQLN